MNEQVQGFLFVLLDVGVYLSILLLTVTSLILFLKVLAKNQAEHGRVRATAATMCTVLLAYLIQCSLEHKIGLATFPITFLCATLILRYICWPSLFRSLIITMLYLAVLVGSSIGITQAADFYFPHRVTIAENVDRSKEALANIETEGMRFQNPKEVIAQIELGLRTWSTALVGAIQLLSEDDSLQKLTAEHTDALQELDLIDEDEKGPTAGELAELGVHDGDEMTDQEELRFKLMDKEATADDRLAALSHFLEKAAADGQAPEDTVTQFQRLTSVELTPELADELQRTLAGVSGPETAATSITNTMQALLAAVELTGPVQAVPLSPEDIAPGEEPPLATEDGLVDEEALQTTGEEPADAATVEATTASLEDVSPESAESEPVDENTDGDLVEIFPDVAGIGISRTTQTGQAEEDAAELATYVAKLADAEAFLIRKYGDRLSKEEMDLLLKEHAAALVDDELQEDHSEPTEPSADPDVLPENISTHHQA